MSAARIGRRSGLGALAAAFVAALLAFPAWAFFSVGSTAATGASAAGALGTPVVATSGVTSTSVTFTVASPPPGLTPTGYRVARTGPTAAPSVCTITGSTGSCTDTAPVDGTTNTYAVVALLAGTAWTSPTPRTVTVGVPSKDTTAPVTTASTSPAPNTAGWNSGTVTVTLTATDASGVAGTYYTTDGSRPTSASTAYTVPLSVPVSTTVRFFSVDTVGVVESDKTLVVKIDTAQPTGAVTSPTSPPDVSGSVSVSGNAADTGGSGVASVQPQYRLSGTSGWTAIGSAVTPTAELWSASTAWETAPLRDGTYLLRALVTDAAGNTNDANAPTRSVTVKNAFSVSAPATATAGTPFTVTLTAAGVAGTTQPISVSGLVAGPNGTAVPSTPPTATFNGNGVATIQVTAVSATQQAVSVSLTGLNRQATTGTVTVSPKAGRIFFSDCAAPYSCTSGSSATTITGQQSNLTFKVSRQSADDFGNPLDISSAVTVNLTVTGQGSPQVSPNQVTITGGQATSAQTSTMSRTNGNGSRTGTITAKVTGYADATLTLQ